MSSSIDPANIIYPSIDSKYELLKQNQSEDQKLLEDQHICKIFDFYNQPDTNKIGIELDFARICKYNVAYETLKNRFKGEYRLIICNNIFKLMFFI